MAGVATEVDVEGAELVEEVEVPALEGVLVEDVKVPALEGVLVEDVEVPALEGVVNGVSVGPIVVLTPVEAGVGEGLYVVVVAPRE